MSPMRKEPKPATGTFWLVFFVCYVAFVIGAAGNASAKGHDVLYAILTVSLVMAALAVVSFVYVVVETWRKVDETAEWQILDRVNWVVRYTAAQEARNEGPDGGRPDGP